MKTTNLNIRMSSKDMQKLDRLAKKHGKTKTAVIMTLLEHAVQNESLVSGEHLGPVAIVRYHDRHPLNLEFVAPLPPVGSKLGVIEKS